MVYTQLNGHEQGEEKATVYRKPHPGLKRIKHIQCFTFDIIHISFIKLRKSSSGLFDQEMESSLFAMLIMQTISIHIDEENCVYLSKRKCVS